MIQRKSSEPMYKQIADFIESRIEEEIYEVNSQIPTETELMKKFNVSRTTVRLALKELLQKGLVESHPGKGTYVKKKIIYHHLEGFKGLYDTFIEVGITPETQLLGFNMVKPTPETQKVFKIDEEEKVLRVLRLYHVKKKPIALAEIYVHPNFSNLISEKEASKYPVYKTLAKKADYRINQAHFEIFAKNSTIEVSRALKIRENDAVLGAERIILSEEKNPVEHSLLWFQADSYRFSLSLEGKTRLHLVGAKEFINSIRNEG